jgi:prepilin-type N-terminal cleavage/methylation domain-containing protein
MQTPLRQKRARQAGFTLIEILIAMIILAIVSAMLVGTWISLQRSFEFSQADNTAASTGRDALDRIASELRAAQPTATSATTPFAVTLASPYVCDKWDCTFYSPYNNASTFSGSGSSGLSPTASILTSIYLDTSGTSPQKKLKMWRDLNRNGVNDAGDQTILLANNVVSSTMSVPRPIFQYLFDTNGTYSTTDTLSSGNAKAVVAVNVEVVIDANLSSRPLYVDFVSTVRPRNVSTS